MIANKTNGFMFTTSIKIVLCCPNDMTQLQIVTVIDHLVIKNEP